MSNFIALNDGTSRLLLNDGTSRILLNLDPAVKPVTLVPIIPIKAGPKGALQLPAALSELAMPKYRPT